MAFIEKSRFRRLAAIVIVAACFAAPAITPAPAQARVFVGFSFGVPGVWGYYGPQPYYYPYPAYSGYAYPVYYNYAYPDNYGYPYTYPAAMYFGHPSYPRHPHRHRR